VEEGMRAEEEKVKVVSENGVLDAVDVGMISN
jgi:hypothetical protein